MCISLPHDLEQILLDSQHVFYAANTKEQLNTIRLLSLQI